MISLLAQQYGSSGGGEAAAAGIMIVALLIGLVIGIGIAFLISWLIYSPYSKLPAEFQEMKPGLVFLMMIPLFGLIWSFFIATQVPASFKAYFDSVGDNTVGDAGKNIALAWAICAACSIIPFLGTFTGLASLVLLIIFIVKLWGMAKRVGEIEPPQSMAM
ncbi:MAG: hypothetical protein AAGA25_16495 [Planctomycetota bacterium]